LRTPWHSSIHNLGGLAVVGLFTAFLLRFFWVSWINPPAVGDRWAQSDTLGYEGDSPRDVQHKIDKLKMEPVVED
jgi:hypothetical protein